MKWRILFGMATTLYCGCIDLGELRFDRRFDGAPADGDPDVARPAQVDRGPGDGAVRLSDRGPGSPADTGPDQAADHRLDAGPPMLDVGPQSDGGQPEPADVRCTARADPPCNGCPAGVRVPPGWICAPPGRITLGSPIGEAGRDPDLEEQREVCFDRPLLASATEATREEWAFLMEDEIPVSVPDPTLPIAGVSWRRAAVFANRRSILERVEPCYRSADDAPYGLGHVEAGQVPVWDERTCSGFRLPTEAEWAWIARAGGQHPGAVPDPLDDGAWLDAAAPRVVGIGRPNAWGVYDVLGNVWEMTWDAFVARPPDDRACDPAVDDPRDPLSIVIRGCGWQTPADGCRLAVRGVMIDAEPAPTIGVRLVRTVLE